MKKTWNSPEVQELTIQATAFGYDDEGYCDNYDTIMQNNGKGNGHHKDNGKGHNDHGNGNGYGHIKHGCDCGDCES